MPANGMVGPAGGPHLNNSKDLPEKCGDEPALTGKENFHPSPHPGAAPATLTDRYGAGVEKAGVRHTPGPWSVGFGAHSIVCVNAKIGGEAKLFDVRGWGYLTGQGHGGLGLDPKTALAIQEANARLAAAAPDMLEALRAVDREATAMRYDDPLARLVRAAIAKATLPTPGGSDE